MKKKNKIYVFEKKYFDTDEWFELQELEVRKWLDGNFKDTDVAIKALKEGGALHTPGASYRAKALIGKEEK